MSDTKMAMQIIAILPDIWDFQSGSHAGKDLTLLPFLLEEHGVKDKLLMVELIIATIQESSAITNEKVQQRLKKNGKR